MLNVFGSVQIGTVNIKKDYLNLDVDTDVRTYNPNTTCTIYATTTIGKSGATNSDDML